MFLNPTVRYSYIDEHQSPNERDNAREVVKRFTMKYAEERDNKTQLASSSSAIQSLSAKASSSLNHGLGNMSRDSSGSRAFGLDDMGVTPPRRHTAAPIATSFPETPTRPSAASSDISPSRIAARQPEMLVEIEHNRYIGLPNSGKLGTVDLVKYLNIQTTLPLLRAMSKDVLPAQASSVSSERIFSSSQLTCTRARNKISVNTIEKPQILKHTLRHSRHISHAQNGMDELDSLDDIDPTQTLDIMQRLGDADWRHDAILDAEQPLSI